MKLVKTLRSDDVGRSGRVCSDKQAFCALLESVNTYKLPFTQAGGLWGANFRTLQTAIAARDTVKDLYAQS